MDQASYGWQAKWVRPTMPSRRLSTEAAPTKRGASVLTEFSEHLPADCSHGGSL